MIFEFDLVLGDGSGALSFEWDPAKDLVNFKKHGIRFGEAATIFQNVVLTAEDAGSYGEMREISFGRLGQPPDAPVILCVVHTDRDGTTRLISARKATPRERKHFDVYIEKTYH